MAITTRDRDVLERGKPESSRQQEGLTRQQPGGSDSLTAGGRSAAYSQGLRPFLPQELIGGSVPHIAGSEMEAVWNAAAQACGTEKVHFTYTVFEKRCWYLACPSASLSSAPDSWCPLAAALPGNSEFWDKETVYLYEQEGLASALRWDSETARVQVFLGASRTLLPRIQSMEANFVTIDADMAEPVPWQNRNLRSEQLSRWAAKLILFAGLALNAGLILFLVFQFLAVNMIDRNLGEVQQNTERASQELMVKAYGALQSDTVKHMVRIQQLLDELQKIDGTLVKYEVNQGNVTWDALVPPAYGQGIGAVQGQVQPGIEQDGRVRIRGTR